MRHALRHLPSRLAIALALGLPASAIAAPAIEDSRPLQERPADGAGAGAVALLSGFGAGSVSDPAGQPPYVPVAAPVDYGTAINRFGGGGMRTHEGQDMFAPEGTRLISPVETTVIETGGGDDRGNWAALYDASENRTFVYMHMLEPAAVRRGDRLAPGDLVGLLGCTGSCDGAHLHFEIRDGRDPYGTPHDPLAELKSWNPFPAG
jgi:murein DD-endopeptidase MepM/ murein hydrolase activator NlpD